MTKEGGSRIRNALIMAVLLFLMDAAWLNAYYLGLCIIFIGIPMILVKAARARKDAVMYNRELSVAGIYAFSALLIFGAFVVNNKVAMDRAGLIIEACENYKAKHGKYPEKLEELLPEFMNDLPPVKVSLSPKKFRYISREDSHSIIFEHTPPFGRRYYVLEEKKWKQMD